MIEPIRLSWDDSLRQLAWQGPTTANGAASGSITTATGWFQRWQLQRKLASLPHNPWDDNAYEQFCSIVTGSRFDTWWTLNCGLTQRGATELHFEMTFPRGGWDIPWEFLLKPIAESGTIRAISLSRSAPGISSAAYPSKLPEPLRVVILKGADSAQGQDVVDINRTVSVVQEAWQKSDSSVRVNIQEPVERDALYAGLPDLLSSEHPQILWFVGHGRVRRGVELLFKQSDPKSRKDAWVSAAELGQAIQASGVQTSARPILYGVFWSCNTARGEAALRNTVYPPALFAELSKQRILSVLAMQAPITVAGTRLMMPYFFDALATGLPLERALARTRSAFLDLLREPTSSLLDGTHHLDWATPVAWSSGTPPERIVWNATRQDMAQLQVLGRLSIRQTEGYPGEWDVITDNENRRARDWASAPRTWIYAEEVAADQPVLWARTLRAIQAIGNQAVLAVELREPVSEDIDVGIRRWAEELYEWLLPQDFPEAIVEVIGRLAKATSVNRLWTRLCGMQGIHLALKGAPPYQGNNGWFWQAVLARTDQMPVTVLSSQAVTDAIQTDWSLDRMSTSDQQTVFQSALAQAPRLARAVAVLARPLSSRFIRVDQTTTEGVNSFGGWDSRDELTVATAGGPVITASARRFILDNTSDEEAMTAHEDCLAILLNPELNSSPVLRQARLDHLLAIGREVEALAEATWLCGYYAAHHRPAAVIDVVRRVSWQSLDAEPLTAAGWAYLRLGRVAQAGLYLERAYSKGPPVDPLDRAWLHANLAEYYKDMGGKDNKPKALEQINLAIDVCREAEADLSNAKKHEIARYTLTYQQDRARIKQYLFYDRKLTEEYQGIIIALNKLEDPGLELAIVKRNYAEYLRTIAESDQDRQAARDVLNEAKEAARGKEASPLWAEILYEESKVAESEDNYEEARRLLEDCLAASYTSQHYMLRAIAQNRIFWNNITSGRTAFDLSIWKEIEADLEEYPGHGWAVRTLVDSRIRVARLLSSSGDNSTAMGLLDSARKTMEQHPSYMEGSDGLRIATIMAGLQVLGTKLGQTLPHWERFLTRYPWSQAWLSDHGAQTSDEVWEGVQ